MNYCCKKWKECKTGVKIRGFRTISYKDLHCCPECGTSFQENDFEKWINNCPKNVPNIEEIRKITAKIGYSMADDSMGIQKLQECCEKYVKQYTVNGDKKHYFFSYCPHCGVELHKEEKTK